MNDTLIAAERLTELEDQVKRLQLAIEQSDTVDASRIDAVRRLRILTNALELIRRPAR